MDSPVQRILDTKENNLFFIAPSDSVLKAVQHLFNNKVGALLVMEDQKLVGILSERDIINQVVLSQASADTTYVKDILQGEVISIAPATTVQEAMMIMTEKRVRHIPVVDNGDLVGMISIGDVTKWATERCSQKARELEDVIHYIEGDSDH